MEDTIHFTSEEIERLLHLADHLDREFKSGKSLISKEQSFLLSGSKKNGVLETLPEIAKFLKGFGDEDNLSNILRESLFGEKDRKKIVELIKLLPTISEKLPNIPKNLKDEVSAIVDNKLKNLPDDIVSAVGGARQAGKFAQEAATDAKLRAGEAKLQGDYANKAGNHAKVQGDYAKLQADNADLAAKKAKEKGSFAHEQGEFAKKHGSLAMKMGMFAKSKGEFAKMLARYVRTIGIYTMEQGEKAASIVAHPPYIDDDDYLWLWNVEAGEYVKTEYARKYLLNWDDMTDEQKKELLAAIKDSLAIANEEDVRALWDDFEPDYGVDDTPNAPSEGNAGDGIINTPQEVYDFLKGLPEDARLEDILKDVDINNISEKELWEIFFGKKGCDKDCNCDDDGCDTEPDDEEEEDGEDRTPNVTGIEVSAGCECDTELTANGSNLSYVAEYTWTLDIDGVGLSLISRGPILILSGANNSKFQNATNVTAKVSTGKYTSEVYVVKE